MIQNAVKKVLLPITESKGFKVLGSDRGTIEQEEYEIVITLAGPTFNYEALEVKNY